MIDPYSIKIGDMVSPKMALDLAKYYKLEYIVKRISENDLNNYKSFRFDGASCLWDSLVAFLIGIDQKIFTYEAACPHDIAYYFGLSDNDKERKMVDKKFKSDLITKAGMRPWLAEIFYHAVRIGGIKELEMDFSWGFGSR